MATTHDTEKAAPVFISKSIINAPQKGQKSSLEATLVSDNGLETLGQISTLKSLLLTDSKVTAAGVVKFKAALPDCEVRLSPEMQKAVEEGQKKATEKAPPGAATGSTSSAKADTGGQAASDTQTKWNSAHWFGYGLGDEPDRWMPEVASYTNLVWDNSWNLSDDARMPLESTLKSARKHGMSVIIELLKKDRLDKFLEVGADIARAYPDVVVAISVSDVTPQELSEFCVRAKQLLPGVKVLSLMSLDEAPLTYPIPDELDGFVLGCNYTTAEETSRRIKERFPLWSARAGKRPVLLAWSNSGTDNIPQCQPGIYRSLAEFARNHHLAGFIAAFYGPFNIGARGFVPLNSRPELVQEMRDIGKEWGVGTSGK